jgi:hypothetical protein
MRERERKEWERIGFQGEKGERSTGPLPTATTPLL